MKSWTSGALFALGAIGLGSVVALALPPPMARAYEHGSFQRVLTAHAHAGGMDYAALAADAGARADLERFVASLDAMPESSGLADWLNAYNAIVIAHIVERWPLASARDVPGFFDRVRTRVAGRARTLDELENAIIRPRFRDARVHFALNCGAVSCPPLEARAFEAGTLSATLDRLARAAVASDAFVRRSGGRVSVSELLFWFHEDFARDGGTVLAWLKRYDVGHRLAGIAEGTTLGHIAYRWQVNHRP